LNKNDLEFEKIQAGAKKHGANLNFLKTIATLATILGCVYIIFEGLKSIANSSPAGVSALAEVVRHLNISGILGYVVAAGCAGGWAMERKGKKRLLPGFAAQRRQVEAGDSYHGTSGLTDSGDTPTSIEGT
jgi:hypothetical protein